MEKVAHPTQILATSGDYLTALHSADKIERAVAIVEKGEAAPNFNFSSYVRAYSTLVQRVIATNDRGYSDRAAHWKLSEKLKKLDNRIMSASVKMGVLPPSRDLIQMMKVDEKTPVVKSKWENLQSKLKDLTWTDGAKYSGIACLAAFALPTLWQTAKKAPEVVQTGRDLLEVGSSGVHLFNDGYEIAKVILHPLGTVLGLVRWGADQAGFNTPKTPTTSRERTNLGAAFLINFWTAGFLVKCMVKPIVSPMIKWFDLGKTRHERDLEKLSQMTIWLGTAAVALHTTVPGIFGIVPESINILQDGLISVASNGIALAKENPGISATAVGTGILGGWYIRASIGAVLTTTADLIHTIPTYGFSALTIGAEALPYMPYAAGLVSAGYGAYKGYEAAVESYNTNGTIYQLAEKATSTGLYLKDRGSEALSWASATKDSTIDSIQLKVKDLANGVVSIVTENPVTTIATGALLAGGEIFNRVVPAYLRPGAVPSVGWQLIRGVATLLPITVNVIGRTILSSSPQTPGLLNYESDDTQMQKNLSV